MKKKHVRNFIVLTTLTTASIYAINKFISISSTLKNLLKTDHGHFYDWKYGKIFYSKSGKGSPIILVHDLNPASSSAEWEKVYKSLSKKHTVYTIDLIGCGRSSKPNLTYTNYLYVQLLTDFITNIIGLKTTAIATGASGSFTVMACNMNPECFDKIILINPEDLNDLAKTPDKGKNILKCLIDLPIIGTFLYNLLYCSSGIEKIFSEKYYYKSHLVSSKTMDTYYEAAHLDNSKGKYLLSSIAASYTNINIVHALEKVKNNIYIVCGKENEASRYIIDSYSQHNPFIEAACVDNSKYLPQMEAPEKLLKCLEEIL